VRYRRVVRASPALVLRGRLQIAEGVINVMAEHAEPLDLRVRSASRDFR
jgi:error-prone DNA polymerase